MAASEKLIATVQAYHEVSKLFDALGIGSRRAVLAMLNDQYGPKVRKRKYTRRYKRTVRRVKKAA